MSGVDPTFVTAAAAIVVALVSGWFSWSSGRRKGDADYAGVIHAGFKSLLQEMEKQHQEDQEDIGLFKATVEDLSEKVRLLTSHIARLESFLREHGLEDKAPKRDFAGITKVRNGQ